MVPRWRGGVCVCVCVHTWWGKGDVVWSFAGGLGPSEGVAGWQESGTPEGLSASGAPKAEFRLRQPIRSWGTNTQNGRGAGGVGKLERWRGRGLRERGRRVRDGPPMAWGGSELR